MGVLNLLLQIVTATLTIQSSSSDYVRGYRIKTQQCCDECPEGLTKYYSISNIFEQCGECCIDSGNYSIYKVFEPGLTLAPSNTICKDLGYTEYTKTEKHGVYPVTTMIDFYKMPSNKMDYLEGCPVDTVSCEYLPGYYQCCPAGEYCIFNVGCRC